MVEKNVQGDCQLKPDIAWSDLRHFYEDAQEQGDMDAMCMHAKKEARIRSSFHFEDQSGVCSDLVGYPHRMLSFHCKEGTCPWEEGVHYLTLSLAIPMKMFSSAVSDIKATLEKRGTCFPEGIKIRFLRKSQSYLGLSRMFDAVVFEINTPRRITRDQPRLGLSTIQEIEQVRDREIYQYQANSNLNSS